MRSKALISIPDDAKTKAIASLRRYAAENLDEELGELKAGLLLDYVLAEFGPIVYNQAMADARAYFEERAADLEGACHHTEFPFWGKQKR